MAFSKANINIRSCKIMSVLGGKGTGERSVSVESRCGGNDE